MSRLPIRTTAGVLQGLEHEFSNFAAAFTAGEYVLWLGSGISREVVPNVQALLVRVLELLRTNVDKMDRGCPYLVALREALLLADLSDSDIDAIDLDAPVASWADCDGIARRLTSKYAQVLDIPVVGQPADFLVWSGLDVPGTYGDPALEPDVEHFCIALLILEGVVSSAVTANWDGLIERALAVLTNDPDAIIRVIVRAQDFREGRGQAQLIKVHGCAVRARDDEGAYRALLVARQQQISGWTERQENAVMRKHVEVLYTDSPSLLIGLSVQDANLHTMIAKAIEELPRPWPHTPPAVVLAEEKLQAHHRHVLQVTYGSDEYQTHSAEMNDSAVLRSYAKPTLLALVLWTLSDKLLTLLSCLAEKSGWSEAETDRMKVDIRQVRDAVAAYAEPGNHVFLDRLIDLVVLMLGVFRTGHAPASGSVNYEPISDRPIRSALRSPDYPAAAFGYLATAISLLWRGHSASDWSLLPGATEAAGEGVLRLRTSAPAPRDLRVFVVKDASAAIALAVDGLADESDPSALFVLAERETTSSVRSPRPRYGRVGVTGAARVSIADLYEDARTADDLYDAFKLVGGLT
ncbi:SIR2 family protein [Gordonia sp. NB41Y]|uniref:SIR2 family protein n=1 Tax=Gordonia sp. NB41Y TaxID=875808 RepID=UPI0002BD3787|nr:SIR2 family protein [Gordonia sp. NB41Y]EMP14530.1 hypothetical protein ISGA_76 [Gordonia sp. NB41Y]WLP91767.1 SIR2 family protein [Gordonia sp. NB41Y]